MPARRGPIVWLWILAATVLLYYSLTPGIQGSKAQGDGWRGFHVLPALALHQTLDLSAVAGADWRAFDREARSAAVHDREARSAAVHDREAVHAHSPRGGRLSARNPIGPTLAMLPVYTATALLEASARAAFPGAAFLPERPFQINLLQIFWTGLVTTAAGLCGVALLYRLLRRHTDPGPALFGAAAALCATPLWWYLTTEPHYQHGLAFAAVTLLIERWDATRGQPGLRRSFGLGLLGGVAMLMRPQEAVFLLLPVAELCASGWRRALLRLPLVLLGAGVGFLPQLLAWWVSFGAVWPPSLEPLRPLEPALAEVLFSLRGGLLPWCPAAYVGLVGLLVYGPRRRLRGLVLPLGLSFLADLYLVAASWVWHGAFGYGSRRLSDCAPLFALGLALLCQGAARLAAGPAQSIDGARPGWLGRGLRHVPLVGLVGLIGVTSLGGLYLMELMRRQVVPSSAGRAQPASRWAARAGAPALLVRALSLGYPFAQPAGWLFALWHRAPATAWESVVGNYALEREAHTMALMGERWDLGGPGAADFVVEGLLPVPAGAVNARPVRGRLRLLVQPFATEPLSGVLYGDLPAEAELRWDGHPLRLTPRPDGVSFEVPIERVRAHRVSELLLTCAAGSVSALHLAPGAGSRVPAHGTWGARMP